MFMTKRSIWVWLCFTLDKFLKRGKPLKTYFKWLIKNFLKKLLNTCSESGRFLIMAVSSWGMCDKSMNAHVIPRAKSVKRLGLSHRRIGSLIVHAHTHTHTHPPNCQLLRTQVELFWITKRNWKKKMRKQRLNLNPLTKLKNRLGVKNKWLTKSKRKQFRIGG